MHRYDKAGLRLEGVSLAKAARVYGTPLYVYSRAMMENRWQAYDKAFGARRHLICYAVKACSNIALLNCLAQRGSGFDVVSGGELRRVVRAGGEPRRTVFSGVGKQRAEIESALRSGVRCLNMESESELACVEQVAKQLGLRAPVAVRLNPEVDVDTHAYTATVGVGNKFGVSKEQALAMAERIQASSALEMVGISAHIGSQITRLEPFAAAARSVAALAEALRSRGIEVRMLDLGGGLGLSSGGVDPPAPEDYVRALLAAVGESPYELIIEPGRSIIGDAGVLLTRVVRLKRAKGKSFAIVDAAMNDLIRPALYGAQHQLLPVAPRSDRPTETYDVVGPVCESGDWLARNCELALAEGDLLAVMQAGAYGFSMASNYNSRPRPAEALIDGDRMYLIRKPETLDALFAAERLVR